MPEVYVRGNTIKYIRVPDEVIDMVKEDTFRKEGAVLCNHWWYCKYCKSCVFKNDHTPCVHNTQRSDLRCRAGVVVVVVGLVGGGAGKVRCTE